MSSKTLDAVIAAVICAASAACAAPPEVRTSSPAALAVARRAAARADLAFRGTVVATRVERDAASGLPFTYVTARIDERLKGAAGDGAVDWTAPGATVTWRLVGGALDGQVLELADAPSFRVGEEAYWLLAYGPAGTFPMLAGLGAGKWTRASGGGTALVSPGAPGPVEEEALRAALAAPPVPAEGAR
ncbi:MAG TPA: hypothetical protein VG389_24175 [Myxococcota bacterium]|nr:hypothetical protein [Myxococcota bacterium]